MKARNGGGPASHTPAPESFATVASFRTWRGLRTIVAGGPTGPPWTSSDGAWLFCRCAGRQGCRNGFETGGEGGIRTRDTGISRIHTFQACSFNHSDTSPHDFFVPRPPGRIVRPFLGLIPPRCGAGCGCPNPFQTNLSNARYGHTPCTHLPGAPLQPLGHFPVWMQPSLSGGHRLTKKRKNSCRAADRQAESAPAQPASTRGEVAAATAIRSPLVATR